MWPWEHAAFGYLLYSMGRQALGGEPPSDVGSLVLLLGTQLPDLVDKPLSWGFGVFPTGYALGHSVLVAVPVGIAVVVASRRFDRAPVGIPFVVGYWSHLMADVLDPLRYGAPPAPKRVLWPIVTHPPYEQERGLERGLIYLVDFIGSLQTMEPVAMVVLYLLLPLGTAALWLHDGAPGLAGFGRAVRSWWRKSGR